MRQAIILFHGACQNPQNNIRSHNTKHTHNTAAFRKMCFTSKRIKDKLTKYVFTLEIVSYNALKLSFKTSNSFLAGIHSHQSINSLKRKTIFENTVP